MINIDFDFNEELFSRIDEETRQGILEDVGSEIIEKVRDKVPVRTGNLLDNTGFNVNDGNLEFYSDTDYAEQVDSNVHYMDEVEFADYETMIAEKVKEVVEK